MGFLNQKAIRKTRRVTAIATAFFLVPAAIFFIIVVVAAIFANDSHSGMLIAAGIVGALAIGEFIFFNIYAYKTCDRITRVARIAEEDHDGIITVKRLSEMLRVKEDKVRQDVKHWIYSKDLINMTFDEDRDAIILGQGKDGTVPVSSDVTYHVAICPTCGAQNTVPATGSAKCKYCGSYLRRE